MPRIDPEITRARIIEWEARHGTPMDPVESAGWRFVTVGGQRFALVYCMQTATYPTVWGYHVGIGNLLSCRHFYFSASEAAWRAGTGFRCGTTVRALECIENLKVKLTDSKDKAKEKIKNRKKYWDKLAQVKPGAWVKSAENFPGVPGRERVTRHRDSGYIYEGMVAAALHDALESWYQANKGADLHDQVWFDALACFGDGKDDYMAMERHLRLAVNLKVSDALGNTLDADCRCSDLVTSYGAEREYVSVVPAVLATGIESDIKQGAPTLQRDFGNAFDATAGKRARTGIAHKIKRSTALWDWLKTCLEHEQGGGVTRRHPVLETDHTIRTYRLAHPPGGGLDADIEIAETPAMALAYRVGGIAESSITTPICWVRSVYVPTSDITTFGTYRQCPLDLSFLVQKPCDYIGQTADDLSDLLGVRTTLDESTARPTKVFSQKQTPLARSNIVRKGNRDVYLSLALFNETTSPLIKAYKQARRYPLFQYKYKTMDKVLQDIRGSYGKIRSSAILGAEQYLSLHDFQSGAHREPGQRRAQAFLRHLYQENYNPENLPRDFHELFSNNRVDGNRDGWCWYHSINTEPQSLFTVVCQCIIPMFCADQIDPRIRELAVKASLPTGPEKSLQRLMHKAIALGIVAEDCERHIQDHSAELLEAVKKS